MDAGSGGAETAGGRSAAGGRAATGGASSGGVLPEASAPDAPVPDAATPCADIDDPEQTALPERRDDATGEWLPAVPWCGECTSDEDCFDGGACVWVNGAGGLFEASDARVCRPTCTQSNDCPNRDRGCVLTNIQPDPFVDAWGVQCIHSPGFCDPEDSGFIPRRFVCAVPGRICGENTDPSAYFTPCFRPKWWP